MGWLLALTVVLALGPAATALACGPSAGDCQYTDPLSTSTTTSHTTAPPVTTTTPAQTAPVQTTTPTATTADPATATTSTTSSKSKKTLPYTGYAAWAGGMLGVFLIAGGIAVRRRYADR